ncbi:MAG: hypothetical protein JSR64_09760 [Nitrospira sp.]|nr:hypothetical protein [Nitrospira sp.]MBS0194364.1 hypothetical protein [Pseudomonadota bacterium]
MTTDTLAPPLASRRLTAETLANMRRFIGPVQMAVLQLAMRGEEKRFFIDKLAELAARIDGMPKTYETDGQGDQAVAHLHYFKNGADWYITEKDMGAADDEVPGAQHQAHGLAFIFSDDQHGEHGYISIVELLSHRVELDLHFVPRTLEEVRAMRAVRA